MGAPGYFKGRVVLHCAHCDDQRTITREAWLKSGQYDSVAPASPAKEGGFWIEESEEIKPGTILILRPPDLGRGENGPQLAGRIINLDAPAASEKRGK